MQVVRSGAFMHECMCRWQTQPSQYNSTLLRVSDICTYISQPSYNHVNWRLCSLLYISAYAPPSSYQSERMSRLDLCEGPAEGANRTTARSPRRAYYDLTRSTMEHYPPPDEPVMDPQITGGIADSGISGPAYPAGAEPVPPQSDVDDLLRKKRKAREHKACYPCRQRKVRYDEQLWRLCG